MIKEYSEDYDLLIAFGDLHFPHHDQKLTRILLDVIEDLQPQIILDGGDIISCDCLSDYSKKHSQLVGLESELKAAHSWFESLNQVSPDSKKILLQDNHFYRRLYDKMRREVWLEDLSAVQPDNLLKLKEYGWVSQKEYNFRNVLMFIHGDDQAGSNLNPINKARQMSNTNGLTVVRFHSHCTGFEIHRHIQHQIAAIQLGTFESINDAGYIKHPSLSNWSNSFGLFYLHKKKKEFFFQPVYFINNKCMVGSKVYS